MSKATKKKLLSFHFDLGNSSKGQIGASGSIKAYSKEEALKILQDELPEDGVEVKSWGEDGHAFEYCEVYFNTDAITLADLDDGDEDEEDDDA